MTDKVFYQKAAAEFEAGVIDDALWIKAAVENPGAEKTVHVAVYIKLRAQEMATERLRNVTAQAASAAGRIKFGELLQLVPRRPWHWLVWVVILWALALVPVVGFLALPLLIALIILSRKQPTDLPPIDWSMWFAWVVELAVFDVILIVVLARLWHSSINSYTFGGSLAYLGVIAVPGLFIAFGTHLQRPSFAIVTTLFTGLFVLLLTVIGAWAALAAAVR